MLAMGSTLTKPDIVAVLELFSKAVEKLCCLGYRINIDGLLQIAPAIGGVFTDKGDSFTSPRNSVFLTAQISRAMNKRIEQAAELEKIAVDVIRPILYKPVDSETESPEAGLVVGNIVSLKGKRLKFDATRPDEYLRLVSTADTSKTVSITKFYKLTDQELVFKLPATDFVEGYFEVASSMGISMVRIGRSPRWNGALRAVTSRSRNKFCAISSTTLTSSKTCAVLGTALTRIWSLATRWRSGIPTLCQKSLDKPAGSRVHCWLMRLSDTWNKVMRSRFV